ncbi:hypothetical protein EA1_00935 [Moraxella catarrhalis O35E]|nr:hypothetical protein EA1_00935 [Moraxella catarrhalis O35E]
MPYQLGDTPVGTDYILSKRTLIGFFGSVLWPRV